MNKEQYLTGTRRHAFKNAGGYKFLKAKMKDQTTIKPKVRRNKNG